jgi:hypothetical protein
MSYSIHAGIEELEQKLRAERIIAERFPDAKLEKVGNGQVWVSASLGSEATDFEIFEDKYYRAYVTIEGMRVYRSIWHRTYFRALHETLKKEHPEVYKTILDIIVKGVA